VLLSASFVSDLVDLGVPAPEKVVRSLLVFVFLIVALRLAGKRQLAQLNVMDLAVLLLVSNALQNAMIGDDSSLLGGIIGASTLFVANYWFVRLTYRNAAARRLLEGSPSVLLQNGRVDHDALRRRRSPSSSWVRSSGNAASSGSGTWTSSSSRPMATWP
jgi:uncharacterized membrane protein YcaP (DUF421 family)